MASILVKCRYAIPITPLRCRVIIKVRHISTDKDDLPKKSPMMNSNKANWPKAKSVWTLPNILTMSRIASTPVLGYFIWNGMYNPALACFAYAAATDFLDGFIARKFNLQSDVGAILDPLADKLLLITSFIALYNVGLMPFWAVKMYIARDLILVGSGATIRYCTFNEHEFTWRKFIDLKNYPLLGMDPTLLSKFNTALQCSVVLTHLTTNHMVGTPIYDWSVFGLHILTATTVIGSSYQYLRRYVQRDIYNRIPRPKG